MKVRSSSYKKKNWSRIGKKSIFATDSDYEIIEHLQLQSDCNDMKTIFLKLPNQEFINNDSFEVWVIFGK